MTSDSKLRPPLPPGPYLVVGLARSGQAVARLLAARGEDVIGCDMGSPDGAAELEAAGVHISLETDGVELLDRPACLVKSPGVPTSAAVVTGARNRGLDVIGELELAWRLLPNRFVAVTGTNGKTTATELLGLIWRTAGRPVAVAGNVGTPVATLVGEISPQTTVVCECSSFQLEDCEAFAPESATLLNVAPDHLDRHPSIEEYKRAKLKIFENQDDDDVAIYNGAQIDRSELGGRARRISFCSDQAGGGRGGSPQTCDATIRDGSIWWEEERVIPTAELRLRGEHNAENAAAAAAAALAMGIGRDPVAEGLRSFPGVPHRLESVGERGGVLYVNDSKATNVAAAAAALRSFDGDVRAILGGSAKGEDFDPLRDPVSERCVACYLIGDAAGSIEKALKPVAAAGVALRRCGDLPGAVRAAADDARAEDVVLLAPACASYDSYRDFEERGEHFRALVDALGP